MIELMIIGAMSGLLLGIQFWSDRFETNPDYSADSYNKMIAEFEKQAEELLREGIAWNAKNLDTLLKCDISNIIANRKQELYIADLKDLRFVYQRWKNTPLGDEIYKIRKDRIMSERYSK